MTGVEVVTPGWCRIGIVGVEADCDLLTALVPGELARRLDELLPGAHLIAVTEGTKPLPVEIDPPSRCRADLRDGDVHLMIEDPELVMAGLDLMAAERRHSPLHDGWRTRFSPAPPDGPIALVEVVNGTPVASPGDGALLVDPYSQDVPAGLILDAYVAAERIHATSVGGARLAAPPGPGRLAAAESMVRAVADGAVAAVVERDGASVVRHQISAWAGWGRTMLKTQRAAEQRYRRGSP